MGSSTRVSAGTATASPSRPANGDRPFSTRSPVRVPPSRPTTLAASRGSSTTASRCDGTARAPNSRVARSDGVAGRLVEVELVGAEPDGGAVAGVGLVAVGGEREHAHRAPGAPARAGDAGVGGHREPARGVRERRDPHAGDARIAAAHHALELEGQLDLAVGGKGGDRGVEGVEGHRRHAVGLGQPDPFVGLGEPGVVAGLAQGVGDDVVVEAAGPGEPLAVVADDPHADAGARGRGERLHLGGVHPHGRVRRP